MKVHYKACGASDLHQQGWVWCQTVASNLLSRPILWIMSVSVTYQRHSTAACVLTKALICLQLPTYPISLLPTHPLICAFRDVTAAARKVAQNPAVLANLLDEIVIITLIKRLLYLHCKSSMTTIQHKITIVGLIFEIGDS